MRPRRKVHAADLGRLGAKWQKLFDRANGGHLKDFQPFLAYFGALFILLIVAVFNSVSLWNGKRVPVKAISAFVSVSFFILVALLHSTFGSRYDSRRLSH